MPILEVCTDPGMARGPYPARNMKDIFSNEPSRAGPWEVILQTGRAYKKRNAFFNGRVWLQKKEDV